MKDILRDSTIGLLLNRSTNGRLLPYADQRINYVLPQRYAVSRHGEKVRGTRNNTRTEDDELDGATIVAGSESPAAASYNSRRLSSNSNPAAAVRSQVQGAKIQHNQARTPDDPEKNKAAEEADSSRPRYDRDSTILVDWEENDPDRPRNWSRAKRVFIAGVICLLTFSVYLGAAIYTSAIEDVMLQFGVAQVVATLGLSLFVLAYGIGPIIFSPLQELPAWGRLPIYVIGLVLFVIFQIPVILAKNIGTILVFRFLAGLVGGPALATGGQSMMDLFDEKTAAIAIGVWALAATNGPVAGPVVGGFAAQANGFQWPIFELLWVSAFTLIVVLIFLPETNEATILVRRAERLRKLTGNSRLQCQAEIDASPHDTPLRLIKQNIYRALRLSMEPAVLFSNSYMALAYAIFYLWFESFPLVYTEMHGFNLGLSGLPFLTFVVAASITFPLYVLYLKYHLNPRMDKGGDHFQPESRLELGLIAGPFIPLSLFVFGWTASPAIHWIWPTIGAALYFPGIYLLFQSISMYLTTSYPKYAASILGSNALFRSAFASAFPLFGKPYFEALGLGGGCSLLAGVSILMMPFMWLLIKNGKALREKSNWKE